MDSIIRRTIAKLLIVSLLVSFGQNCSGGLTPFKVKVDSTDQSSVSQYGPFRIERTEVKLLPLSVRLSKIKNLLSEDQTSLGSILENRIALGDSDGALSVAADPSWNETRISLWLNSVQPVCQSQSLKKKYSFATAKQFLKSAYGRTLTSEDDRLIDQVRSMVSDDNTRFEILCSISLSSLEFNTL